MPKSLTISRLGGVEIMLIFEGEKSRISARSAVALRYVIRAQQESYRTRSAFKIKQMDNEFQRHFASWSQLLAFQSCHFLTVLYEPCSDYQIEAPTSAESVILSVAKATVSPPPYSS